MPGALAVVAKVAQNFLTKPGGKRSVIVKVLNREADDRNSATLPLQVAVSVVDVAPRAAMVGAIGLHDQDSSPASHQKVRAPCVA